jgi:hypothetical protein
MACLIDIRKGVPVVRSVYKSVMTDEEKAVLTGKPGKSN